MSGAPETRGLTALAARAVVGVGQTAGASSVTLALGALRAVLLARFLAPEDFGVVAFALFFLGLGARLRDLGLDNALIHRQAPGEPLLRTYFALRLGLDAAVAAAALLAASHLQAAFPHVGGLGAVLPPLVLAFILSNVSQVQETMLRKRLAFASLAKTDIAASAMMTAVAPYLAWRGYGVWALVAEQITGTATRAALMWGPFRAWRPRAGWSPDAFRELWLYGRSNWLAANLHYALDQLDDFWIGFTLGKMPLGFYSKSCEFAHYPRRVFANPLVAVFAPVFAALQHDRTELAQAAFRSAAVVIRIGFLTAGLFAAVMPEFIAVVIGSHWRPLLWTFRIMVVYAALDPLMMLVAQLFLATGRPRELQRVRLVQLAFFVPAVAVAAPWAGINGVAAAANGMLLLGLWAAHGPVRQLVDVPVRRLVAWPAVALAAAALPSMLVELLWHGGALPGAALKAALFATVYAGCLGIAEPRMYVDGLRWVQAAIRNRPRDAIPAGNP